MSLQSVSARALTDRKKSKRYLWPISKLIFFLSIIKSCTGMKPSTYEDSYTVSRRFVRKTFCQDRLRRFVRKTFCQDQLRRFVRKTFCQDRFVRHFFQVDRLRRFVRTILRVVISWAYLGHISGISRAYLGHILGISRAYLGHILGISRAYLRQSSKRTRYRAQDPFELSTNT